jgi:hypothetical protein
MGSEWAAMILGVDTKKLLHFRRLKRLLKLVHKWGGQLDRPSEPS